MREVVGRYAKLCLPLEEFDLDFMLHLYDRREQVPRVERRHANLMGARCMDNAF
jgi:hypothetical protein